MSRAVARGRARKVAQPIPYIVVDEKAFRKGQRYHTNHAGGAGRRRREDRIRSLPHHGGDDAGGGHRAQGGASQALHLKVGRAWAIKEALRALWTYRQGAAVTRFFSMVRLGRSRLAPVKKVAGMRNAQNFTTAIYFHCGGLDPYPR